MAKYKPQIIFEIGGYLIKEHNISMMDYFKFFKQLHYSLYTVKGKLIIEENYHHYIPNYGTVDLVAIALEKGL